MGSVSSKSVMKKPPERLQHVLLQEESVDAFEGVEDFTVIPRVYHVFPMSWAFFLRNIVTTLYAMMVLACRNTCLNDPRRPPPGEKLSDTPEDPSTVTCATNGLPPLPLNSLPTLFEEMIEMERKHPRNPRIFDHHPELTAQHRSNLIEWLSQTCYQIDMSKCKFLLTMDYMDRYLSKSRGQVGVKRYELVCQTALHLTLLDDRYLQDVELKMAPPFPDNPHWTAVDFENMERDMTKHLTGRHETLTTDMWLAYILQFCKQMGHVKNETNVFTTSSSQILFIISSRVCSACLLDVYSLNFSYRIIAASALWLFTKSERIVHVSGLTWPELFPCVYWMVPCSQALKEMRGLGGLKHGWESPQYWEMENFPYAELDLWKHAMALEADFKRDDVINPRSKDVAKLFEQIQAIDMGRFAVSLPPWHTR